MDVVEFENRESLARRVPGPGPGPRGRGEGANAPMEIGSVPPTHPPTTPEHRSNKLLTLFRTLIFLGDLARYREQYGTHPNKSNTEGGRRPRGGRRGKDKGGEGAQEKRYAKAEAFYVQARLLLPDYGAVLFLSVCVDTYLRLSIIQATRSTNSRSSTHTSTTCSGRRSTTTVRSAFVGRFQPPKTT